jgi:membrane associated rhomboid family serine protease
MNDIGYIGLFLILINAITTYWGLKNHSMMDQYAFNVDAILIRKDYKRIITSGFLHLDWMHFIFNMVTLACFSFYIETVFGEINFIIIYFSSLIGGGLLALFIHRNHGDYKAIGASGAINGIVFASIALFPKIEIGILFLPFQVQGWIFGLLYTLITIYGIKTKKGNIGHEAHLGGGIIAIIAAIAIYPEALKINTFAITILLIPTLTFIIAITLFPNILLTNSFLPSKKRNLSADEKYNLNKLTQENEINKILDKINSKGISSLNKLEKEKLDKLSK